MRRKKVKGLYRALKGIERPHVQTLEHNKNIGYWGCLYFESQDPYCPERNIRGKTSPGAVFFPNFHGNDKLKKAGRND